MSERETVTYYQWDWTHACLHLMFCKKNGQDCAICEDIRQRVGDDESVLVPMQPVRERGA